MKRSVLLMTICGLAASPAATTISAPNQSLQGSHLDDTNARRDVGSGVLTVGNNSSVSTDPRLFNGIFVFDISGVPDDQFITSAQLNMRHVINFGTSPGDVAVDLYLVGFSNAPNVLPAAAVYKNDDIDMPGGTDGFRIADDWFDWNTLGEEKTIEGIPLVTVLNTRPGNGALTNNNNYVFFRLNNDAPVPDDVRNAIGFSNLPAYPTLSITYDVIPEPSAALLGALSGLIAFRRRRP